MYYFVDLLKYKFLRIWLSQIMAQKNPANNSDGCSWHSADFDQEWLDNEENWTDVLPCSTKELLLHLLAITAMSMFCFSKYYLSLKTVDVIYSAYIHDSCHWLLAHWQV